MILENINFEDITLEELKEVYNKILARGNFSETQGFIIKACHVLLETNNPKRLLEFCQYFEHIKKTKHIIYFYKTICLIQRNTLTATDISKLRNNYLNLSREKDFSNYENILHRIVKYSQDTHDLIRNELSLLRFFKDIFRFDQQSRGGFLNKSFEVDKNWLVKQLILFFEDSIVLNCICIALIHQGDSSHAQSIYQYLLSRNIDINNQTKKWSLELNWNLSQKFQQQSQQLEETQILNYQDRQLPIEAMLRNVDQEALQVQSAKDFLDLENKVILRQSEALESFESLADLFSQSFEGEDDNIRVNFLIENHFFEQAIKLINQKLKCLEIEDISDKLKWYYLALFTYNAKKDYNKTIECSLIYQSNFSQLSNEELIEINYLLAEAFYFLSEYEQSKKYFQQVCKANSDYRLTKVRLEEINRF